MTCPAGTVVPGTVPGRRAGQDVPDHQLDAELEPQAAQAEGERLDEAVGQRVRQVAQEHGEVDPDADGRHQVGGVTEQRDRG